MPSLNELRSLYPQYSSMSDGDIVTHVAKQNGLPLDAAAEALGVSTNAPGFWSGVRQGLGGFSEGIGRVVDDATDGKPGAITRYGQDVQLRNPSSAASQSWEGFKADPWQGVKEFAGSGIGSTLPTVASFAIPGVGEEVGASMLARGIGAGVRGLQSGAGQTALAALPIYGQVRGEQDTAGRSNDPDAIARAAAAALGGGWVESKLGVNRMLGRDTSAAAARQGLINDFAETPWKTARNAMGRQSLEEGAEELVQQPMQQWAAYQDPTSEASLRDTAWSGFGGVIGGAAMSPLGGFKMGRAHSAIRRDIDTNLLNLDNPVSQQANAAQWQREFVAKDQGREAADNWYSNFMNQQNDARVQGFHDQQRNETLDRIYGGVDRNMLALPAPVIRAEGSESQVPLSRLDELYARRQATSDIENNGQMLSDELSQRPVNPGFDFNTQSVPLPGDVGSSIALLNQLGNTPIQYGTPLHAAVIRAGEILDQHGIKYAQPTPVAKTGSQAQRGNQGRGTGNTQNQSGVGRGRNNPAGAPVASGGANLAVGNTSTGVGAVKPGTIASLKQDIDALFPLGTPENDLHSEAIGDAKSYSAARKSLAKVSPDGLKLALRTAPAEEQRIVQTALGWDAEGNSVSASIPSYSEVGKVVGKTRQRVQQVLAQYGINKDVLTRMGAVEQTAVSVSELMPSQQEDGGVKDGTGYRVMDNPNGADDFVNDQATVQQTAESNKFAAEQGVTAKELAQPSNFQTAAEVRGEEIAQANREAHAAKEREAAAKEAAVPPKASLYEQLRHIINDLQEIDIKNAAELYDEDLSGDELTFDELPNEYQAQWVKAAVNSYDGKISARDLARIYGDIADANKKSEGVEQQPALAGVQAKLPASSQSEGQQVLQQAGQRPETERAAPEGQSESEQAAGRSDSETENGPSSEVTAEKIIEQWNTAAKAMGVTPWDGLSAEQKDYILGSGTWDEVNEAANEVLGEINSVEEPQFSEGEKHGQGSERSKIEATLRKLFFSPQRFGNFVNVVQSVEDITGTAKKDLSRSANANKVQGFVGTDGKVYLIADNIEPGKELAVFLHEVGVHLGMERLLGTTHFNNLLNQIETWSKSDAKSLEVQLAKAAMARANKSSSENQREEALAYFIELAVNSGINPQAVAKANSPLANWFRTLWAAAKVALRKIGLGRFDSLTAQNLVDLSYGAAKLELSGAWHGTAAKFRNFDHSYMGSGEGAQAFGWGTYLAQAVGIAKGYWKADAARKRSVTLGGVGVSGMSPFEASEKLSGATGFSRTAIQQAMMQLKDSQFSVSEAIADVENSRFVDERIAKKYKDEILQVLRSAEEIKTEGSLMRVDSAVHDDEMLDWDKPLSEQAKVASLLEKVKPYLEGEFLDEELDRLNADWNELTGKDLIGDQYDPGILARAADAGMLYDAALVQAGKNRNDPEADKAYENGMLTPSDYAGKKVAERLNQFGQDRLVSEYLDSIGIKGIKFLDANSRSPSSSGAATTLNDVGLGHLAGKVDHYGKEKTIPDNAKVRTRGNTIYVQVENNGLPDFIALDTLSRNGNELLDDQGALDALFAIKKFVPNQTRNLVIFNDKNIQRVTSQVAASRSNVKFSEADSSAAQRVGGESGRQVYEDTVTNLKGLFAKGLRSMMSLHDLINEQGKILPSAQKWYDSVRATIAKRNQLESDAESIAARAGKLKAPVLNALNSFISRSTYEQKWGYDATFKKMDGSNKVVKADPEMAREFKKLEQLSPEAAQIAKDVFAHGEKMKIEKFTILKNLGLSGEFNQTGALQGPYAPLKRFGNYVAVLKSQAVLDAEAAYKKDPTSANQKKLNELKADAKHYMVANRDTRAMANRFLMENGKGWAYSSAFEKSVHVKEQAETNLGTLKKVLAAIKVDESKLPPKAFAAIKEMLLDMHMQGFDEHNARMSGLKRENRAGYDSDMIRSFLAHSRAEAGFLANMEHGGKTNEMFYSMQRESAESDQKDRAKAQDVFNAIASHYAANLENKDTPIQNRLMAMASVQQLATNPAYHLQNLMQPTVTTVPRLAADFGDYPGAWGHLRRAYGQVNQAVKGGLFNVEIDLSKIQNKNLRETLQLIADAGLLDVGMDEDLTKFDTTHTGIGVVDKASQGAKRAIHKLRQVARRVEATNRIAAGTAAYTMALEKGKTHDEAKAYALSVVQDTQGDFSRTDSPLVLKKLPKIMGQYRKFQLLMMAHYAKAFRDAFISEDPKVQAIGRRMLAYSLFHAFATAGALGLPMMNLVAMLFSALGSDDEPQDLERSLREWIGDESMANLLLHGPLWFMGMDAKLSQDKVFSLLPYSDWNLTSKDGIENLVVGAMGPAVGTLSKLADGLGTIGKGEYYKGLEKLVPNGISNGMKAFRIANEGYTLNNGDVMVKPEDISGFQLALDAVGMKSPEMRHMDWFKNQQYEIKRFYVDRTKEIEHTYGQAYKAGDTEAMSNAREAWVDLQKGKDHLRMYFNNRMDELKRQPLSTLLKYPQTQAKRELKLQRGVPD